MLKNFYACVCLYLLFFQCVCVYICYCVVYVWSFLPFLFFFRLFNISFILLSHCLGSDTNQYLQSVFFFLYIKLIFSFFNFNETFPPNFASHTLVVKTFSPVIRVTFLRRPSTTPGKWDFLLLFTLILF